MDKYQKFRRHIRFCFSASIGGIFYVIKYCADPACWNVYELALSEDQIARFAWDVGDRCGSRTVCFESAGQQYSWNFIRTPENCPDYHSDKGRAWAGSVRTEENRKIRSDDVLCPCKPMTAFCQHPLYAVSDKHTAENRTSNTKISFLTVRRRQKIKDA